MHILLTLAFSHKSLLPYLSLLVGFLTPINVVLLVLCVKCFTICIFDVCYSLSLPCCLFTNLALPTLSTHAQPTYS